MNNRVKDYVEKQVGEVPCVCTKCYSPLMVNLGDISNLNIKNKFKCETVCENCNEVSVNDNLSNKLESVFKSFTDSYRIAYDNLIEILGLPLEDNKFSDNVLSLLDSVKNLPVGGKIFYTERDSNVIIFKKDFNSYVKKDLNYYKYPFLYNLDKLKESFNYSDIELCSKAKFLEDIPTAFGDNNYIYIDSKEVLVTSFKERIHVEGWFYINEPNLDDSFMMIYKDSYSAYLLNTNETSASYVFSLEVYEKIVEGLLKTISTH